MLAFVIAIAAPQLAAAAQPNADRAAVAVSALTAQGAEAFEEIDPDSDMPTADEATAVYAGLPPLDNAEGP
jgi:hypothetical protein